MSGRQRMTVAVPVATVWTKPESARQIDRPALGLPADVKAWLTAMTPEDNKDLCESNRTQTQLLYGTGVLMEEERDGWARVLVPSQTTRKNTEGYPGWMPRVQLAEAPKYAELADAAVAKADVTADKAWLYRDRSLTVPLLELSYMTSLPLLSITEEGGIAAVATPQGTGYLRKAEVRLDGPESGAAGGNGVSAGLQIAQQGVRFLGLPYLWAGLSSYGYDCSGFAYSMHRYCGITIPRDASDQARHGISVEQSNLMPGDLLFFAHEEGKGAVHHVGIYIGEGQMVHSPRPGRKIEIVKLDGYELEREHCVSRRYWS